MARNWKQWAVDRGLQKWFRKDNFIVLVLAGILLIIIALPTKDSAGQEENTALGAEREISAQREPEGKHEEGTASGEADAEKAYTADLEARLTETLSQIEGMGRVKVMITLKASRELVVEKEQPTSRSTANESDSQGGSRIVSQMESEENTVYRTDGSLSEPYVVMTLSPKIEGVLVVAEGAGSGTLNRTIVEIVQALFGVDAHKVQVVRMEKGE